MSSPVRLSVLIVGIPVLVFASLISYWFLSLHFNTRAYAEYGDFVVVIPEIIVEEFEEDVVGVDTSEVAEDVASEVVLSGSVEDLLVGSGEVFAGSGVVENIAIDVVEEVESGDQRLFDGVSGLDSVEMEVVDTTPAEVVDVREVAGEDLAGGLNVDPVVSEKPSVPEVPLVTAEPEQIEEVVAEVVVEPEKVEEVSFDDYQKGLRFFNAGQYDSALPYLEWQAEFVPANVEARTKLRELARKTSSKESLEQFYLDLIGRYPNVSAYPVSLGTLYMSEFWNFEKARLMYNKALEMEPGNEAALYNLELIRQIEVENAASNESSEGSSE